MSTNGRIKVEQADISMEPGPADAGKGSKRQRKPKDVQAEKQNKKDKKPPFKQEKITDHMPAEKKKRKIDRFNGMPEEEVILRTLPDHLAPDLDIVIIGFNPGLMAAYIGHHYAGPGNHFWKCMYLSGLVPEPKNCYDDFKLLDVGIGFTNICARTTRGSADLKRTEIKEGSVILKEKLREYRPKIAAFNGKGIYEIFSGSKNIYFGKQPELIEGTNTVAFVMPSSSARCAQLPRATDKVPFYDALRKLRDHLLGRIPQLDDAEVTFPNLELKCVKKEGPKDEEAEVSQEGSDEDFDENQSGALEGEMRGRNRRIGAGSGRVGEGMVLPVVVYSSVAPSSGQGRTGQTVDCFGQGHISSQQVGHTQDMASVQQMETFHMQQQNIGFQQHHQYLSLQQQQQLSLQQQHQHLQHQLWEHQQHSLVGLPQALPVASSMQQSTSFLQSPDMSFADYSAFGMLAQSYPFVPDFSSSQSVDAFGYPVAAHGQQDFVKSGTQSTEQVLHVKTEPVDVGVGHG